MPQTGFESSSCGTRCLDDSRVSVHPPSPRQTDRPKDGRADQRVHRDRRPDPFTSPDLAGSAVGEWGTGNGIGRGLGGGIVGVDRWGGGGGNGVARHAFDGATW